MKLLFDLLSSLIALVHGQAVANEPVVEMPKMPPYRLDKREGETTPMVILQSKAIKRLHITTVKVLSSRNTPEGVRVPSSSVLYDPHGVNWMYAEEQSGSYYRIKVILRRVEAKTSLVTIVGEKILPLAIVEEGVSALYGTESGVGK